MKRHVRTIHFLRWNYLASSEMQLMISIIQFSHRLLKFLRAFFPLHWMGIRYIKRCARGIYITGNINKFHLAKIFPCRTIYITRTWAWDFELSCLDFSLLYTICRLSLTRKNICNLIGWEEYNIGHIVTLFSIFVLFD